MLSFTACKKVDKLTQFDIEYEVGLVFNNTSPISSPFSIATPPQETNASSEFESNDTRKDKIEQINLTKMYLQITNPPSQDFSFLDEVEIFISAEGLSEISLAYRENIPNNIGSYLELNVNGNDFKEYIKKDKFTLRVRVVQDEQIFQDVEANCYMKFFVDAKVAGI